ncbi:hypothetical protein MNBD_GAMMA12-926 [hydrothermal vent metagenome]|uniref:Uncharacterized protein n=1 Tax=hydrothermal vent metagenome TaxID=652676 RepID=A0A3B0YDE5_9ZZZZ
METNVLVQQAIAGDKSALEAVVGFIQDDLYYLALRMLANPDDAKDATQEILIKIITKLSTFKFESQFKTWAYRIASNYLITEKKIKSKDQNLTYDLYKADLESDLQDPDQFKDLPEYPIMLNELRITCTMAMLLCLNSAHRMAYILGDIFELEHQEASEILSITKDNFRQQLSRARAKVVEFTSTSCGLVSASAKCQCEKKLVGAVSRLRVDPKRIQFSNHDNSAYSEVKRLIRETRESLQTLKLQNYIVHYKCPIEFSHMIESLVVDSGSLVRKFN